ncbi:hypothetical protein Cch01nite_44610 [Cellulomonas chitinilytica]|uniref:Lipoprotein n=1 Tax=Cellulomonas chitinilytica TaxID=398759 RepID=A0A919U4S4_9CELL|nr:hypothetical protein [Cellulomonas chitinilytica]GIG23737.1 hypothetical protein Cch01nite_44610 [Cellulomonas chitinilytica]
MTTLDSPRTRRTALLTATAALALLAACSASDPLAGLGGPGLAERCAAGLPQPEGTVDHACNDGQGRTQYPLPLEPGSYDLVALCDGADDLHVVLNPAQPLFETATAVCDEGSDPTRVPIGTIGDATTVRVAMSQLGEGDTAWFIVRR